LNSSVDWCKQLELAKSGVFDDMDPGVFIRNHSAVVRIAAENARPKWRPNVKTEVHWGVTGSGKSHGVFTRLEALDEDYYVKNANTKWWCGYRGQKHVVIDEFTGRLDISYLLTWLDKYPAMAEIKGSNTPLEAVNFYIMSNVDPWKWYSDEKSTATVEQINAMMRRFTTIKEYTDAYVERTIDDELDDLFNC